MKPFILGIFTAALAISAAADPVITSITPNTASTQAGQAVTVRGTGFATCIICSPPIGPAILFGSTPAQSVQLISSTELSVITPAHLPGTVDVTVVQNDTLGPESKTFTLPNAFTFTGDLMDGFETILLPLYMPPVRGAFGSEFQTIVTAAAKTDRSNPVVVGIDMTCLPISPPGTAMDQIELKSFFEPEELPVRCSTWPARMLFVSKETSENTTFNVRVLDVTRNAQSHGTEIPVVRSADMKNEPVVLVNVPIDARFRNTLRIYSPSQAAIPIRITIGNIERIVTLQAGRMVAEPSIATLTDFPSAADVPAGQTKVRVTIDPPVTGQAIWAFITVTNNETQEITTVTPD